MTNTVPPTPSPPSPRPTASSCAATISCGTIRRRAGFSARPDGPEKERAVFDRIQQLAGRYRGRVHSWDVVNEPIEPKDGRPDGLRTAVFLEKLGPEYLDLAYRAARDAD